ncbi:hypothetical protein LCL97_11435 [Seohaeicola saemankumensis]|nr:hypothetical protein [Seohaeicola saemankumensis]MCA0871441.1 hypothetical protein [Seohaeicola saemankumensis]
MPAPDFRANKSTTIFVATALASMLGNVANAQFLPTSKHSSAIQTEILWPSGTWLGTYYCRKRSKPEQIENGSRQKTFEIILTINPSDNNSKGSFFFTVTESDGDKKTDSVEIDFIQQLGGFTIISAMHSTSRSYFQIAAEVSKNGNSMEGAFETGYPNCGSGPIKLEKK